MEKGSLEEQVSEAIFECLRAAPVRLEELHAFAQGLALSYLALLTSPSPSRFSDAQLEIIRDMIRRGVKVEWLIEAFDRASMMAGKLLRGQGATVGFATAIAKMVAAQANLQAAGA